MGHGPPGFACTGLGEQHELAWSLLFTEPDTVTVTLLLERVRWAVRRGGGASETDLGNSR